MHQMIFQTFGNSENAVIVMLVGSFCPAESLEIVYSHLKKDYYIIAPTYNEWRSAGSRTSS